MKRSMAREEAFLLVFERAFREATPEELVTEAEEGREAQFDDFARNLVAEVLAHLPEIDKVIEKYSTNWKLSRLPKVTLGLLRIAVGEIDYVSDVPVSVTINEAVELAKKYAEADDASYINGVLGAYVRDKTEAEAQTGAEA